MSKIVKFRVFKVARSVRKDAKLKDKKGFMTPVLSAKKGVLIITLKVLKGLNNQLPYKVIIT